MRLLLVLGVFLSSFSGCNSAKTNEPEPKIEPGAWQLQEYLEILEGKNIGLVINQTSSINEVHLVDTLLSHNLTIKAIFAPEHGFRGDAYDGEIIDDSIDPKTGIPIISLYGSHKKPTPEDLQGIDIIIYDIQDVGARFYTFISTMHYVMEACAENNKPLLILDRPNPNGYYVDGPVLDTAFQSFVGMHPIPIVYGLTNGELAQMINGEGWLDSAKICNLQIIKNKNYSHNDQYTLPIAPSPNLPNQKSITLYPSLCLFEPTVISIGRGTIFPFQVLGYPDSTKGLFSFTPVSIEGVSKYPKYQDLICYGEDLRETATLNQIDLSYLVRYFTENGADSTFFRSPDYFDKLAGTDKLRQQLLKGKSVAEIKASWADELKRYGVMRKKYLLYPDFK